MQRLLGNQLLASGLAGRGRAYAEKVLATRRANLVAYWPLAEPSGSVASDRSGNARHGAYTGVDLAQPGIGDGGTAPYFDGADFVNIYSASLAAAFNGAEGTILAWCKVPPAAWSDATNRRVIYLAVNASNRVTINKATTANGLVFQYVAGGVTHTLTRTLDPLPAGWFSVGISWSKTADQVQPYLAGIADGAPATGLGVFVGALLSTTSCIGATSTSAVAPWLGHLAHVSVWNVALSAAEIARLGRV